MKLPGDIEDQGPTRGGLVAAQARGAAARARWIEEGLVVPGPQLAQAWGIPQETLATAAASGEVVSIAIDGGEYFPRALLSLDRLTAGAICRALGQIQDTERLMFWLRGHGALGGTHPAAALSAGTPIDQVIALARAWARERTEGGSPMDANPTLCALDRLDGLQRRRLHVLSQ